jgi:sugar phosphate isomerase/epimerase
MSDSLEYILAASRKPAEFNLSAIFTANTDMDYIKAELDRLADNDLRFVEIRGAAGKSLSELTDADLKALEKNLSGYGIQVSAVGSAIGAGDLALPFEPEVAQFERMLEIADWLGSSYVGIRAWKGDFETGQIEVLRRLNRLAEIVMPYGMILVLENAPGTVAAQAAQAAALLQEVGSTNLRCLFNPANFGAVGERSYTDAYFPLQSQITYLRYNAADAEFDRVLAALHESQYAGYVTLEADAELTASVTSFQAKLLQIKEQQGSDFLSEN